MKTLPCGLPRYSHEGKIVCRSEPPWPGNGQEAGKDGQETRGQGWRWDPAPRRSRCSLWARTRQWSALRALSKDLGHPRGGWRGCHRHPSPVPSGMSASPCQRGFALPRFPSSRLQLKGERGNRRSHHPVQLAWKPARRHSCVSSRGGGRNVWLLGFPSFLFFQYSVRGGVIRLTLIQRK